MQPKCAQPDHQQPISYPDVCEFKRGETTRQIWHYKEYMEYI